MGSPFEYREIMKAHFHYNETRTVDEVLAEHRQRHDDSSKGRSSKGRNLAAPATSTAPRSELEKARAMLANAPMRPAPTAEPPTE